MLADLGGVLQLVVLVLYWIQSFECLGRIEWEVRKSEEFIRWYSLHTLSTIHWRNQFACLSWLLALWLATVTPPLTMNLGVASPIYHCLRVSWFCCYSFHQTIINHGALPCLLSLLTHNHKKSIKKEACWTISNITAGNREQIQVSHYIPTFLLDVNPFFNQTDHWYFFVVYPFL